MKLDASGEQARFGSAVAALALVAALVLLAIQQTQPPTPLPASAPANVFSALRALEDLRTIAQRPHPTGSPDSARVREYILARFRALGLAAEIQTATTVRQEPHWPGPAAATVNNIVARLKGTQNTRALMLAAHYDSVAGGPGASDDGSGVVTLLETARALKAGSPLRNDVIFLVTDGEELGLLGAQAFVDESPAAREVGLAINFDARGACGPSMMFEASTANGWLIRQFGRAAPYPVASSMFYEVYRRMPNDTDATLFKRAGMPALNFAFAGCWWRYHTLRDDLANISLRSLQHDGVQALALARYFGNLDLRHPSQSGAIYFAVLHFLFSYPASAASPLLILSLALFAVVTAFGLKRQQLTWKGILAGFGGWLGAAMVSAAISQWFWILLEKARLVSSLPDGVAYNGDDYLLGFIALTVAIVCSFYAVLGQRVRISSLATGALAWWAVLAAITTFYARGASYLFVLPLLAGLVELGYAFLSRHPEAEAESVLVWTLPAIVGILLFGIVPYMVLLLLSNVGLLPTTLSMALLVGYLAPWVHVMTARRRWLLPSAALAAALAFIVVGMLAAGYSDSNPRADSLFYVLDSDSSQSLWASADAAPDAWTAQFFGSGQHPEHVPSPFDGLMPWGTFLGAPAPSVKVDPPSLQLTDDVSIGTERTLRFLITSPRHARVLWVEVRNAKVLGAAVNGKQAGTSAAPDQTNWGLVYTNVPERGFLLDLTVEGGANPEVRLVDQSDGLPPISDRPLPSRPHHLMPSPAVPFDSSTLVSRTFRHFEMHRHP